MGRRERGRGGQTGVGRIGEQEGWVGGYMNRKGSGQKIWTRGQWEDERDGKVKRV